MKEILTTPLGKAVYPKLNKPDTKFNADGLYNCKLHVTEEDFKKFQNELNPILDKAYKDECDHQGNPKLRKASASPLRITDEGDYEIYSKQDAKKQTRQGDVLTFSVAAFDSTGAKIAMPDVDSGSLLKMACEVHTWYQPSLGFGYTLRLRAVQIIELIEYKGQGDFNFAPNEGGYVGEGENLNDAFEVEENETGDEKEKKKELF